MDKRLIVRLPTYSSDHARFIWAGFLSPAFYFHRAIPQAEYQATVQFTHECNSEQSDWYMVRVRQKNGHWAWSSPIWVEADVSR